MLFLKMAVNDENISKLFLILSHKIRRDVLVILFEKKEQSFSDLMNELNIDTGKMSFHLRNLKLFLEQTPTGKYRLNTFGQNALRLIRDMEALSIEADFFEHKNNLHIAKFSRRTLAFIIDMAVAFTITIATTLATKISVLFSGIYSVEFNIFLFLGLLWLYSTLLEGFAGQTLGKSLMKLKVVSVGGKRLFYDNAAVRNFGKCFLLPIDLLVGLRLKDKRFIKFFDKFSGTTVIKL
ncbi:MAG: RDD family protein [Desulfobacterales bacterium]|nr:RDD family protein [Desulfobacterales bacterium]